MKIATPNNNGFQKKPEVLLPLKDDVELDKLDKTNSVSWELSTRPGTADAATYKFLARILIGNESTRQMIRWRLDLLKVCVGLNVTTLATRQPVMEACMRPGPQAAFRSAMLARSVGCCPRSRSHRC